MLELKITGANAQELFVNAAQLVSILARGCQAVPAGAVKPAESAPAEKPVEDKFPATDEVGKAEAAAVKPKTVARKKGAPAEVPAEKPAAADAGGIPDFLDRTGGAKGGEAAKKEYTLTDCREQVRLSLENYVTRARAAGETDEKTIMDGKVKYTLPLLTTFGVNKASDLKPEQFAEFMKVSKAYVEGTA